MGRTKTRAVLAEPEKPPRLTSPRCPACAWYRERERIAKAEDDGPAVGETRALRDRHLGTGCWDTARAAA